MTGSWAGKPAHDFLTDMTFSTGTAQAPPPREARKKEPTITRT
jgi:hypothetical protein